MKKKITGRERSQIISLLEQGVDRASIAVAVGVTPGQVSAIAAHVTMRSYQSDAGGSKQSETVPGNQRSRRDRAQLTPAPRLLDSSRSERPRGTTAHKNAAQTVEVLVGIDTITGADTFWTPSPHAGTPNPHLLIVGESGAGKTYLTQCIAAELVQKNFPIIVFDFGQGFALSSAPKEFIRFARPVEIHAGADGININPLSIFPSDLHGPANVAQRIADTFARVYPTIGVQQHAVLREAILQVFKDNGFEPRRKETWTRAVPEFGAIQEKLSEWAADKDHPMRRQAASAASHVSTVFVFNTFRTTGLNLNWKDLFDDGGKTYIIQLKGLEHSLERIVTELLLWNLIGFIESLGPGGIRSFVLLDEAHRLEFSVSSPSEKLLREARKFGVGLILASQQPEDFSGVAFTNTASKLVLNVTDERGTILRQILRKVPKTGDLTSLLRQIKSLPRGVACFLHSEGSQIVRISDFKRRAGLWEVAT